MIELATSKCLKNLEHMVYIKDVHIIKLKLFISFKNLDICCHISIKTKFEALAPIYYQLFHDNVVKNISWKFIILFYINVDKDLTLRLLLGSRIIQCVEVTSRFSDANPMIVSPIMRSRRILSMPYKRILIPMSWASSVQINQTHIDSFIIFDNSLKIQNIYTYI